MIGRCRQRHHHLEFVRFPNAVEGLFAKLTRQRLKRGVFTLTVELPAAMNCFIGDANDESEGIITEIGKVKRLGRLPMIAPLTPARLKTIFAANFSPEDFK